VTIVTNNK